MARNPITRRTLIKGGVQLSLGLITVTTLPACTKVPPCFDPASLGTGDRFARQSRSYEEQSPISDKDCANCSLFSGDAGACGICTVDNLPAAPTGYCTSWSAT